MRWIIIAALTLLAACNACEPPLVVDVVDADMGAQRQPGHCLSHPGCGNPEDGGTS